MSTSVSSSLMGLDVPMLACMTLSPFAGRRGATDRIRQVLGAEGHVAFFGVFETLATRFLSEFYAEAPRPADLRVVMCFADDGPLDPDFELPATRPLVTVEPLARWHAHAGFTGDARPDLVACFDGTGLVALYDMTAPVPDLVWHDPDASRARWYPNEAHRAAQIAMAAQ